MLMAANDGRGVQRSYLANEDLYGALRDMEERNLIVPLVGDFAGPKALRSVARYLDLHRATVSVFYTSNVEQYLFHDDDWARFYRNVSALPIEPQSTFIRSFFNQGRLFRFPSAQPDPQTGAMQAPPGPGPGGPGPRSETLLNPIAVLLDAFAAGRVSDYGDVIELSRERQ
jgi:hypothetical protein